LGQTADSTTMPASAEIVSAEMLARLYEIAFSDGVPGSFVVSSAFKAFYHSQACR
jgi:hypothetical protein